MTKKDYILLAQVMADARPYDTHAYPHWHAIVVTLSDRLKRDNPAFDAVKFRKACDLPATPAIINPKRAL